MTAQACPRFDFPDAAQSKGIKVSLPPAIGMCSFYRGQGATEYLVLLAVVLIVALVSVALLGFFPGMVSDAQITQSQMYWQSASPIAITEWGALTNSASYSLPYLRVRNTGVYPIRITKLLGPNGNWNDQVYISGWKNISDNYYLAPGEENYFSWGYQGIADHLVYFRFSDGYAYGYVGGASSLCNFNNTASPGTLQMDDFGFEYIEYIEGQQITKRQVGKPLVIKCRPYP